MRNVNLFQNLTDKKKKKFILYEKLVLIVQKSQISG